MLSLLVVFGIFLTACKTKEYTVKFVVEGEVVEQLKVKETSFVKRPNNPQKADAEFDGWYKSEDNYTESNRWIFADERVTKDVSLYGRFIDEDTELLYYEVEIQLPTLHRLEDAKEADLKVVEDAPELLIIGAVLDTFHFFQNESMSGYEYIKLFNNTEEPYNLKDHRIVLADPLQGQNGESEAARKGNKVLVTGYLFNSYIEEDLIIDPLSTMLLWLKPYYWTIGSGTGAINKTFSADLVHTTFAGKKGAFEQTIEDFKELWELDETIKVYEVTNQPQIAKRKDAGTEEFFPMISPGAGVPFTHINASLLRSLEIQKFDNQGGSAKVEILNNYKKLSVEERENPERVFDKIVFNAIHITENGETIDIYTEYENAWKYFKPVVRIQIHGLIDETHLEPQHYGTVDLRTTKSVDNPGAKKWENTVELQYRPPRIGERIMQLQIPMRELRKFQTYLIEEQLELLRIVEGVTDYRWETVNVYVTVNPELVEINWRTDEIKSPARMNAAAPTKIKLINLTRP